MIITELYDGQGLGNQLWAYVVTRLIAFHKECDFSIRGKERFKGRDFVKLDFGIEPIIKNYYQEKNEIFEGNSMWPYDKDLFNVPLNTKIDGNFQSYQYIRGDEDLVRSWFDIKPQTIDENICLIHMRCGDYLNIPDVFLPKEYYYDAMDMIEKLNPNVVFKCISDQPEIAESLLGVECIGSMTEDKNKASHHFGGDVGYDFSLLLGAKYLIIPNSSFSWWGAFLNTKKEMVIAPNFWAGRNKGYWQTKDIKSDGFTYV